MMSAEAVAVPNETAVPTVGRTSNIPSLDGLRALSISLVFLGHVASTQHAPAFLRVFQTYAEFGVRVFFVLSGYLITHLLLSEHHRTGRISLSKFYARRFFRIFPPAYAYIAIVALFAGDSLSRTDLIVAFGYLTNFRFAPPWLLGHLWSLAVEEQFYLLWPLILIVGFRYRLVLAVIAAFDVPVIRVLFYGLKHFGVPEYIYDYLPHYGDAIGMGCLLAVIRPRLSAHVESFGAGAFGVAAAIALAVPWLQGVSPRFYGLVGVTVMHACMAFCIDNAVRRRYRWLNTRPMVWIGVLSYSLYLWQQPFLNHTSTRIWAAFPQNLVVSVIAAAVSYYVIERPVLKLRQRFALKA